MNGVEITFIGGEPLIEYELIKRYMSIRMQNIQMNHTFFMLQQMEHY